MSSSDLSTFEMIAVSLAIIALVGLFGGVGYLIGSNDVRQDTAAVACQPGTLSVVENIDGGSFEAICRLDGGVVVRAIP